VKFGNTCKYCSIVIVAISVGNSYQENVLESSDTTHFGFL